MSRHAVLPEGGGKSIFGVGLAWLCLGGKGQMKGLADALRPWNLAMRECRLCVHFLSKALKIKLPCLNIYF